MIFKNYIKTSLTISHMNVFLLRYRSSKLNKLKYVNSVKKKVLRVKKKRRKN